MNERFREILIEASNNVSKNRDFYDKIVNNWNKTIEQNKKIVENAKKLNEQITDISYYF